MNNIVEIFNRLTINIIKKRILLVYFSIQNITLSLLVLIFSNVIISNATTSGVLNYNHIRLFFTICILLLFVIVYILTPIFSSTLINGMANRNIIDNLIASRVKSYEIVFASFLRAFSIVFILLFSAIPIICLSFYFGGIGIATIFKIFIITFSYMLLFVSICIYLSANVNDMNVAVILSYIVGLFILIVILFFLNFLIGSKTYVYGFLGVSIVLSTILLIIAKNSVVFNQ